MSTDKSKAAVQRDQIAAVDAQAARASVAAAKVAADRNDKPEPPKRSHAELIADVEKNRERLAAALDAIEYKLNVPKQAKLAVADVANKIRVLRDENPAALAGGIAAVSVAVGAAVFFGVRLFMRR